MDHAVNRPENFSLCRRETTSYRNKNEDNDEDYFAVSLMLPHVSPSLGANFWQSPSAHGLRRCAERFTRTAKPAGCKKSANGRADIANGLAWECARRGSQRNASCECKVPGHRESRRLHV